MDSNASGFFLNTSSLHSVCYQGNEEKGIIDLGLSLRTLQPEATYHPSTHVERYNEVISWPRAANYPQMKSSNNGYEYSREDCICSDDETEGVQSREMSWSYVKVNMDGVLVGRKVCMLHHAGYSALAHQLEEMFGRHTVSGLRLLELDSDFALFYKDTEGNWRNVGDIPWKEFVDRVKRLRISLKNEALLYPSSSSSLN